MYWTPRRHGNPLNLPLTGLKNYFSLQTITGFSLEKNKPFSVAPGKQNIAHCCRSQIPLILWLQRNYFSEVSHSLVEHLLVESTTIILQVMTKRCSSCNLPVRGHAGKTGKFCTVQLQTEEDSERLTEEQMRIKIAGLESSLERLRVSGLGDCFVYRL